MELTRRKFIGGGCVVLSFAAIPSLAYATIPTEEAIAPAGRLDITVNYERMLSYAPDYIREDVNLRYHWLNTCLQEIADIAKDLRPDDRYIHPDFITVKAL